MAYLNALIVTFCALSAAFCGLATAHAEPLTEKQIDAGAKLLAEDFRPYVIELDRDVTVYHYFKNPRITEDLPLHDPRWEHELISTLNYYWVEDQYSLYGHDPVYAAADPYVSNHYGDHLLEVTLPKGTHVLVGHRGIKLSANTIAAIKDGGLYPDIRFDSELDSIPRSVLAQALALLDVEVATYSWSNGDPFANTVCAQIWGTFLLLGTPTDMSKVAQGKGAIAKHMTVRGYSVHAQDFSDPEKRDGWAHIKKFTDVSNGSDSFSKEEIEQWRDSIYSCDGVHPSDEPQKFNKADKK